MQGCSYSNELLHDVCLCACLIRHSTMTVVMLQLRECLAKLQGSCQLMVELMAAVNVTHVYYTNLAHLIRNLVTKVTDTVSNASQICACCCTIEIACCSIQLPVVLELQDAERGERLWPYCTCHAKTLSSLCCPVFHEFLPEV